MARMKTMNWNVSCEVNENEAESDKISLKFDSGNAQCIPVPEIRYHCDNFNRYYYKRDKILSNAEKVSIEAGAWIDLVSSRSHQQWNRQRRRFSCGLFDNSIAFFTRILRHVEARGRVRNRVALERAHSACFVCPRKSSLSSNASLNLSAKAGCLICCFNGEPAMDISCRSIIH